MTDSCVGDVCGTGTWNGPKPGDPDFITVVTATPAFGGIDINWSFPGINPHAVAHTIIYRGLSQDELSASRLAVAAGNFYYDKITLSTEVDYYYWVQIVSVNGTYSKLLGPATARARPTIAAMLELLTAQIDAGMLAQSLKTEIGRIELNSLGLTAEILARAASDDELGAAYNEVSAHSGETRALLQQEVLARTTATSAVVEQVNTLYAKQGKDIAAVQSVQKALVDENKAVASSINKVNSTLYDNSASGEVGLVTKVEVADGKIKDIGALYTAKVDVNGLIGGFGVYNDGRIVEAGFDVDRFWVGRTTDKIKPFIIEGSQVFIREAVIKSLTFTKLRDESGNFMVKDGKVQAKHLELDFAQVSGAIQSSNYLSKQRGWKLDKAGTFENNGGAAGEGRVVQNNTTYAVYDGNNKLRVELGKLFVSPTSL